MKSLGFDKYAQEWVEIECPGAESPQQAEEAAKRDGIDPRHVGQDQFKCIYWVQGPRVKRG